MFSFVVSYWVKFYGFFASSVITFVAVTLAH